MSARLGVERNFQKHATTAAAKRAASIKGNAKIDGGQAEIDAYLARTKIDYRETE